MKASQNKKPTSNFTSKSFTENIGEDSRNTTNSQQYERTHCPHNQTNPIIPRGDDSRKEFFTNAWLHYMNLLVKNEQFIIESKKNFVKSAFVQLLHNQIDISNKLFMLVSQADEESFNYYKAFIHRTTFPQQFTNPAFIDTMDQSKAHEVANPEGEVTSIKLAPLRHDCGDSKEPSCSKNMLEITQSICNCHNSNEEKEPLLKSSLVTLNQQEQINNDKLNLSEELSVSNHGSIFCDMQFLKSESSKPPRNIYRSSINSLTNLDDLDSNKEDNHEDDLMASQSQNNLLY